MTGTAGEGLAIPKQARVEAHCCDHGKHDYPGECKRSRAGFDRHVISQLQDRDQDAHHENIDHRPTPQQFREPVKAAKRFGRGMHMPRCRSAKPTERRDFQKWNEY
jgi:hypothetical protein